MVRRALGLLVIALLIAAAIPIQPAAGGSSPPAEFALVVADEAPAQFGAGQKAMAKHAAFTTAFDCLEVSPLPEDDAVAQKLVVGASYTAFNGTARSRGDPFASGRSYIAASLVASLVSGNAVLQVSSDAPDCRGQSNPAIGVATFALAEPATRSSA